jgi:hypothetical protein
LSFEHARKGYIPLCAPLQNNTTNSEIKPRWRQNQQ